MITSKDFLINYGKTPTEDSDEFNSFWSNELKKCQEGIWINNIFINPFLYWHCNLWTIITDDLKSGYRVRQKPTLRDSEWILTEKIWEAETWKDEFGNIRKKGVVAAGTRRFSKTELEASFCAWKAVCWRHSQVLVSGLNEPDIKIITDRIDLGLNELPNYFVKSKVEDNWKKQVALGYKDKITNERNVWSSFAIRNFDGGANEEALAGLTPSGGVIDEGGKGNFLKALLAGLPGLSTANGWRGTFLVMGTGGDMDSFNDFKTLFDDPESYNFLAVDIPDENRKCGLFLPGYMSYAYPKEKKKLTEYLGIEESENKELANIEILVSNKVENEKLIDKERALASKSADRSALLKTTMYFPKNTREIFMSDSNNRFPQEVIKSHTEWLQNHYTPTYVDFYRNSKGVVDWKYSESKPLNKFPITPKDEKEAPAQVFEFPIKDVPNFTYVIGVDPYNNNESNDKIVSLGSICVYKRMLSPLDEFKDEIVCSWAGRYKEIKDFHELVLMIAEYYNAVGSVLPEASENTLIQYFNFKRKGHYLADSFDIQRDINKFTKASAKKGLPPSVPNQRHYMNLMVEEANQEVFYVDGEGLECMTYGVTKIRDIMLLTEMSNYKGKVAGNGVHDGNFDRIISYGCALTLAKHFDTKYPILNTQIKKQEVDNQLFKQIKTTIKTPFGTFGGGKTNSNMFGTEKGKSNLPRWMR